MKRIESFLDKYSWLLKSGIWMLLILWAAQINSVFVFGFNDIKNQPPRDSELEQKFERAINSLNQKQLKEAKEKGSLYGPEDYFDDLKEIELLKYEFSPASEPFSSFLLTIPQLQAMCMENVGDGNETYRISEMSYAAENYRYWLQGGGPSGDEFQEKLDEMSMGEIINIVFDYFSNLYLKGFFLALFLFLIKMANRRGILETIFADKVRFVYSVLLWPFFLMKYPHNVVKEIIVEAELRRIGNLFRRLTPDERDLVRSVAESKGFWKWIRGFHLENKLVFERSFVVALAAVIVINVFSPISAQADDYENLARAGPEISTLTNAGHACIDKFQQDEYASWSVFDKSALCEDVFQVICLKISGVIGFILIALRKQEVVFEIAHVPIDGYLFKDFVISLNK